MPTSQRQRLASLKNELSASKRGFISLVVLIETVWVMQSDIQPTTRWFANC